MKNYFRKILTSGLLAGAIALTPSCGEYKEPNAQIMQDSQMEDIYIGQDGYTNLDSLVDVFEQPEINGFDISNEDANVEDVYMADANEDANVEDVYMADANEDANVEDVYMTDANEDTNVEDAYMTDANEDANVEDAYMADANEDVYVDEDILADTEEEPKCYNLNEAPTCLGEDYTTLVSTGAEMNSALNLGYSGVTNDQEIENPNVVSGNPCSLPNYFVGTCNEWVTNPNFDNIATIKLADQKTIEIQGNLLERIAALTLLMDGDAQGTECIVTGVDPDTATIDCNGQPNEE